MIGEVSDRLAASPAGISVDAEQRRLDTVLVDLSERAQDLLVGFSMEPVGYVFSVVLGAVVRVSLVVDRSE